VTEVAIDRRRREHRSPNYAIGFAAWRARRREADSDYWSTLADYRINNSADIERLGPKDVVCGGCGTQYVSHKRSRRNRLCGHCWAEMQRLAATCAQVVGRAIATGLMLKATNFSCADCGQPACVYDHRDYTKPLEVEPVCRKHNATRGHAAPFNRFAQAPTCAPAAA
jgi:hypothetical protein